MNERAHFDERVKMSGSLKRTFCPPLVCSSKRAVALFGNHSLEPVFRSRSFELYRLLTNFEQELDEYSEDSHISRTEDPANCEVIESLCTQT